MIDKPGLPKAPITVLVLGIVLLVAYFGMRVLGIGKIGQPTDIGGGLLAIAGFALAGIGLVATAVVLVRRRAR